MKKILIKIFCVIAILIVFDKIFGFAFQKYIFAEGGNVNYLLNKKRNVDFIILGTSRAKYQIDPSLLKSIKGVGYNAGINGVGEDLYNSALLDIILNSNIKPKVILLQTDANNYVRQKNTTYSAELSSLYPYYNKSRLLRNYSDSLGYEERFKLHFNMYRFNGKIYEILFNFFIKNSVTDNNGFVPLNTIMDTTIETFLPYSSSKEMEFDITKLNALNNIITLCKHHDIKLLFVLPPTYNNVYYSELDTKKLMNYIESRTDDQIINMADVRKFKDLQSAKNWKDENHLNYAGAAKFSQYLNDSLKINLK